MEQNSIYIINMILYLLKYSERMDKAMVSETALLCAFVIVEILKRKNNVLDFFPNI